MPRFHLTSPFEPTGDQPRAIAALSHGLAAGIRFQTLLGVTGSGKTHTVARVIEQYKRPVLVLSHNKTLAAQLYEEFRAFFPENAVHYFVSYYDYYQPEAYIPQTDTYIRKDASINKEIDQLRHAATQAVLTRDDVIVVASVSAIYNIGSPDAYQKLSLTLVPGQPMSRRSLIQHITDLQYERNDMDLVEGAYRIREHTIELVPPTGEAVYRITLKKNAVHALARKGRGLSDPEKNADKLTIFPAKFWVTPQDTLPLAMSNIEAELAARLKNLKDRGRLLEAQRLEHRTREDLAMLRETGYCHGIENYSRHLEFREPDDAPFTLLDYFKKAYGSDWLTVIDESHQTIPQIRGMVRGDRARKETLVQHGFRLPSAKDNRPLTFKESFARIGQTLFVSATPGPFEEQVSQRVQEDENGEGATEKGFVEQLIRPTGVLDPTIEIHATKDQLPFLLQEIEKRIEKKERVLVTTLTKRLSEELAYFLEERGIAVMYLHADIDTLKRPEILHRLRSGEIDVLVGINLLREGLDLPEVSLVAILDADQEGFLRNETTLIQTMGRAARHVDGHVILFADRKTQAMQQAIKETQRRRAIQKAWNEKHNITPRSITKALSATTLIGQRRNEEELPEGPADPTIIKSLTQEMQAAAKNLEFERAAKLRDTIERLQGKEGDARG